MLLIRFFIIITARIPCADDLVASSGWKMRCSHLTEMLEELKIESARRTEYLENKIEKQRGSLFELRNIAKDLKDAKEGVM
jgi:hypothetical protein